MNKTIRAIGAGILAAIWLGLTAFAWFGPSQERSEEERRKLAQMPELTFESLLDKTFMEKFEDYSLDQFPLRNSFRTLKALGAHVAFGGLDSLTPFSGLQKAVLREGKEALSVEDALTIWTCGGAWTGFQEDALGRLRQGYQADLAVLDRDIFTLPQTELHNVRPVLTMAAGRVLYREI